jgi:uncharacterized delta-60 repeat protein
MMRLSTLCVLLVLVFVAGRPASAVADASPGPVLVRQSTLGAIAVRPNGAIVLAGRTVDCPPNSPFFSECPGRRTYLVEFDRLGHLVPGFGSMLSTRRLGGVFALAIGPEGDVFLAGKGGWGFKLARFDRHGHLDPSFGRGGVVALREVGDRVLPAINAVSIGPDGAVVGAGIVRTGTGGQEVFLLRLRPDGSFDPSFGTGGIVLSPSTLGGRLGPSKVEALALTDDGRIVVAGSTERRTVKMRSALFAARYLHDGQADLSFGDDGQSAIAASKSGHANADGLAVLPGGEVVLAGSDHTRPATFPSCAQPVIARLLGDGRPDPTFGGRNGEEAGVLRFGSGIGGPCSRAASVLGDGNVTFALSAEEESPVYLDRRAPDGTRDPGFASPHSTALTPPANGFLWHFRLALGGQVTATETVRPRCRPISGGTKTRFPCRSVLLVARDADGRLRRGFGRNGMVVLRLPVREPALELRGRR